MTKNKPKRRMAKYASDPIIVYTAFVRDDRYDPTTGEYAPDVGARFALAPFLDSEELSAEDAPRFLGRVLYQYSVDAPDCFRVSCRSEIPAPGWERHIDPRLDGGADFGDVDTETPLPCAAFHWLLTGEGDPAKVLP